MRYWRPFLRFLAALQLLPALESGEETLVGGQAVMEGVMMRLASRVGYRHPQPTGEITTYSETLQRLQKSTNGWDGPSYAGLATLGQAMRLGFVASSFLECGS